MRSLFTQCSIALIRAYQPELTEEDIVPILRCYEAYVTPNNRGTLPRGRFLLRKPLIMDACASIGFDIGFENFLETEAYSLIMRGDWSNRLLDALLDIPSRNPHLEERLVDWLHCYKYPLLPRRVYEYRLIKGSITFNIKNDNVEVLHPFFNFVLRH